MCGRTRCTFLFLRNSSGAKPDAPLKGRAIMTIKGATITATTWGLSQSEARLRLPVCVNGSSSRSPVILRRQRGYKELEAVTS